MPQWIDDPRADDARFAFRILRTPPDKPVNAIITCVDLIGCNTHYAANRTIPCEGKDRCQACQDGLSFRWHGYVSAILTGTLEHVLFECTATAADTFRNYYMLHQTMRGCFFTARRPSGRHNGRVVIACKPVDEQRTRLPDPPDVRAILCHVWNVQYNKVHTDLRVRFPFKQADVQPSDDDGRNRLHPPKEPVNP